MASGSWLGTAQILFLCHGVHSVDPYVDSQEQSYDFCCHDIFLVAELGCNVLQNKGNPPGGRTPTVIATFASFDQHVYGGRPPEGYLLIVSKVA